jgi:hypothetical protein
VLNVADANPADENLFRPEWCPACGYLLRGLPEEGRCPECGAKFGNREAVYLFGWDGTDRAATRSSDARWALAVVFWLLGLYVLAVSVFLFNERLWPPAIMHVILGVGSLYYATSRVLADNTKPKLMAALTEVGFGQRRGFGDVILHRWGDATEVSLQRQVEGRYWLDIIGVSTAGLLDSNRHISIVFIASDAKIGKLREWIETCKRASVRRDTK